MMDGFLDAECVVSALFESGIFTRKAWKLDKVTASSYDVIFELADSARCAGFTIFVFYYYKRNIPLCRLNGPS
jgi:hypothetical protein